MQSVQKRCLLCGKDITIFIDKNIDALDEKLLRDKEALCRECAGGRGLDPEAKYFLFAGSIYQKFANAHLKLWPVGTFH